MPLFEDLEQNNNIKAEPKSKITKDFQTELNEMYSERNKRYEFNVAENQRWVQNIVSPERIAEWEKQGTMSALEVFNRKEKNELVPFMGTVLQANKNIRIRNISDAMRKGLYISPEDKAFYEQFVLDMAEIQTRGYTFGGKAVNAGLETLPFMVEFGAGLLTTGGTSSLGATAAKIGVKGGIKKAASEALESASKKIAEEGVVKTLGKGIGKVAYDATLNPRTYAFSLTRMPQQVMARYGDIMLSDSLAISEEGQAILLEAKEKPATAFVKALALTNIEVASEMAGATLLKPTGAALNRFFAPKIMSKLPEKFATRFTKVAEEVTGMPFVKGVEALGFNGLIEEMGEERVGDILRFAFNLDDAEGYSFEQFLDAAFPSAEQLAVEAVTFGVMGAGAGLADAGLKKVSKKYSKDEFLIDSGIMRGAGELESIIDKKVRAVLKYQGKTEEEIEQAVQFGTREQKVECLRENKNIITEAETSEIAEVVADRYRASGRKLDDAKIDKISKLFAGILSVQAEKEGRSVDEMLDLLPSVEQVNNYMYVSDDGVGYSSEEISQVYGRALEFYNSIEETEETKEQRLKLEKDIQVLEDMANGKLKDEDAALAYNILGKNINKTIGGYKYNQAMIAGIDAKQKVNVVDLSTEFEKNQNLTKDDLTTYLWDLVGKTKLSSADKKALFEFVTRSKRVGKRDVLVPEHIASSSKVETKYKKERNVFVYNIVNLLQKSVLIDEAENKDKEVKPNVNKYLRFYIPVKINNDIFVVRITAENNKKKNLFNVLNADVYDLIIDKKIQASSTSPENQGSFMKLASNNSITPSEENSSVEALTIEEMLKGVKDSDGNAYFQSAYHGGAVNFDRFDLGYALSGEGAMAHGWGVYLAQNRDVSEGYRKRLVGDSVKWLYDGQEIKKDKEVYIRAKAMGKEALIDSYEKQIKRIEEESKISKIDEEIEKILGVYTPDLTKIQIDNFKHKIEVAKNIDVEKIERIETKGQLYEVDIPEDDVLLDEQEMLIEQSEFVQEVVERANKELGLNIVDSGIRGGAIYDKIADKLGSEKEASLYLNKLGIKGITYDGRQDGRCYVIFDDKAVKILNTFYQEEGEQYSLFEGNNVAKKIHRVKGGFLPAENFIELFENADESTIIHETGHWFLNTLVARAEYSEEIAQDLEEVRKYLKNTGEPFTREQHEKFARGFEAYILNGNARSNRLKKIFEDFKNWLFAIYDNIKDVGYKIEDMPEVEKLFNRLFSSERERIQKTVFDKCNAIDEQIQSIKDNQEKELDELDTIWRENQEVLNRKQDKKREIDEYLALAKTAAKKEPKELKEYKERYKEATLEILEAATGFDRKFIANKKNWEKVENAINDTADKINVSGGFQKHWAEFYTDEGVDYETDDITGGFELASEAFNVLKEGKYSFDNTQDSDIQEFAGQFDYIYGKILSLKGEEKETALNALYALIGDMPSLPDEYVANILEKVSEIEAEYEEQQKHDFNRKRYPNVPVVQQLQWFVTNKLRELKVYNPETKYRLRINKSHRLYSYIKNAVSVNSAKKVVRKINSYVIEDLRNQQRGLLHKEIQKQVKINSKVLKTGGVKKGKFDWRTNTVFAELKEMNKLSKQEALEKYEQLIKLDEIQKQQSRDGWDENSVEFNDFRNEFDENLKRNFLEYKSAVGRGGNLQDLNVEMARTVLNKIMALKQKGREAKDKRDYDEKVNMRSFRNSYVDDIKKNAANPKQKAMVLHLLNSGETLANWETTINAILGSKNADDLSLLLDEARVETYQRDITLKLYQKIAKIYNLKKANWFDKALDWDNAQAVIDLFQNFEKEVFTITEKTFSINTGDFVENNVEITKGELITLYGWAQNDNLKQRLYTQYGMPQLEELFKNNLTDKDKDLAWAMIDTLESMYADINDVFIETTGFSLPHEQNYLPSVPERVVSPLDMMQDFVQASRTPSGVKARKICNRIKMKPVSPMQIVLPHINKMSRYVIMQERLAFYRQVFADLNILATLKEVYGKKDGEGLYRLILAQLDGVSFSGTNRANGKLKEFADKMSKNYIVGNIAGSLKVALGQLTSMINYSENMPVAEWSAGFAKSVANPAETFKFMVDNCPYLQARLAGNTQNEIVASLTNEKDKYRKLTNFFTSNVKWGDIIAITLGGRPYVEYLMKQGMSKEEAFDKFVLETLRAQQAGSASSTSQWQKHQSNSAIGRMFWAFRNTEFQYERKVFDALLKASRGDMTQAQAIKTVFLYRILNPILFQCFLQQVAIAPLLRLLFGEDDEPEETLKGLGVSGLVALVTANLSHWGYAGLIAGGLTQTIIKVATKSKDMKIFETEVPALSEIEGIFKKFTKKSGADFIDYVDAVACFVKYGWGIPAPKLVNAAEGVYDISQGNVGVGLMRMAGWGEYTATEAITGEAPKKKKKK